MLEHPTPDQTRRPGIPAHPIRLADGNAWGFAQPSLRLVPSVIADVDSLGRLRESIGVKTVYGYPLEIHRHGEALRIALEEDPITRQHQAFFTLAAALLRRAHDIDLSASTALLDVDASEFLRLADEVISVMLGERLSGSPKTGEEVTHD